MTIGNRLTDMEFDEISLVTRPANQLSKVVLYKSDSDSQENQMSNPLSKGKMIPPMDDEMEDEEDEMKKGRMKKGDAIDIPQEVFDYISALEAANAELTDTLSKYDEMEDEEDDEEDEDIMKSADPRIVEIVKSAERRAEEAEKIAKAERDHRLTQEFISKAEAYTHLPVTADKFGLVLKSVADAVDADTFAQLVDVLNAANEGIKNGNLFAEVGKSATAVDSHLDEISKAAARVREANPLLTKEQAIAKAVELDPSLYNSYLRGN